MKLSDFKAVDDLVKQAGKLKEAVEQLEGGVLEEFENNSYQCYLVRGSGDSLDLSGCYVAGEVAEATLLVLKDKLVKVNDNLRELGVEVWHE